MPSDSNDNKDAVNTHDTIMGMPRWFVILVLIILLVYIIYIGYKNGHFAGFGGPGANKMYHLLVPPMQEFECVTDLI